MKTIDDTTDRGKRFIILVILGLFFINCNHEKTPDRTPPAPLNPPAKNEVDFWLTNGDQTVKLQKQNSINNGYLALTPLVVAMLVRALLPYQAAVLLTGT